MTPEPTGMRLARLEGQNRAKQHGLETLRDLQEPHGKKEPTLKELHSEVQDIRKGMMDGFIDILKFMTAMIIIMKSPELLNLNTALQPANSAV